MQIKDVLAYLWTIAPAEYKEDWDNVGFLIGRSDRSVTKVLVALDATREVALEADRLGCELVVTHHPVIFHAQKQLTDARPDAEIALSYIERGIAVISMHTNLDCAPGGVNDVLAACLGLKQLEVLQDGETAGLVRMGSIEKTQPAAFAAFVKKQLCCPGLRFVPGSKAISRVAVGGGACAEYIERVCAAGCDCFVTSDVKYHEFQAAKQRDLTLIDAGHFETENPVCAMLRKKLAEHFPALQILASAHADCIEFL